MESVSGVIIFFVKHPSPGAVKSRLARRLGNATAVELYSNFVRDMLDAMKRSGYPIDIFVTPGDRLDDVRSWLAEDAAYHPQFGSDLGERMEQAFHAIFARGVERAILIGSDIPDLPAEHLANALDSLERHEAVIGPARDGGYYLIGFRKDGFAPEIFRGVAWSSPDVFGLTMRIFGEKGTAVQTLTPWQDADTVGDLRDLWERSRSTPFASSRTIRHLDAIKDLLPDTEDFHGTI